MQNKPLCWSHFRARQFSGVFELFLEAQSKGNYNFIEVLHVLKRKCKNHGKPITTKFFKGRSCEKVIEKIWLKGFCFEKKFFTPFVCQPRH